MINTRIRRAAAASGLVLGLAVVSACGGSAASTTTPTLPADGIPTLRPGNPFASVTISLPVASGTVTGHVGDKLTFQDYGHDPIDVTLVKVFDPAVTTDAHAEHPSGAHWVGAEVVIDTHDATGADSQIIDATASDGTLLTTDDAYKNTSYPIGSFQGCTQQDDDFPSGTYCVAFVVPDGQTITQVGARVGGAEIQGNDLVAADQATWSVP